MSHIQLALMGGEMWPPICSEIENAKASPSKAKVHNKRGESVACHAWHQDSKCFTCSRTHPRISKGQAVAKKSPPGSTAMPQSAWLGNLSCLAYEHLTMRIPEVLRHCSTPIDRDLEITRPEASSLHPRRERSAARPGSNELLFIPFHSFSASHC